MAIFDSVFGKFNRGGWLIGGYVPPYYEMKDPIDKEIRNASRKQVLNWNKTFRIDKVKSDLTTYQKMKVFTFLYNLDNAKVINYEQ